MAAASTAAAVAPAPYLVRCRIGESKGLANFRIAEFQSVAQLAGVTTPVLDEKAIDPRSAFFYASLPSVEVCRRITERAVLTKGIYERWGDGRTLAECVASVRSYLASHTDSASAYLSASASFSVVVIGTCKKISTAEQKVYRDAFAFVPFGGRVDLTDPNRHQFCIMIDIPFESGDQKPINYYFGRLVSEQHKFAQKYSLKERHFLGTTSTCAELSFLMANQALARPGAVMLDPFVGTGSILVSCGHFGSYCVGTDIDWLVLHGKTKGATHNVMDNFRQYKLPLPELICGDNSCPTWRGDEWVDGIVCDPPYGVRAGARKTGKKEKDEKSAAAAATAMGGDAKSAKPKKQKAPKSTPAAASATAASTSAPTNASATTAAATAAPTDSKSDAKSSSAVDGVLSSGYTPLGLGNGVVYPVEDVMDDLLALAARLLRVGGRLVYLLPTTTSFRDEELPAHPCFVRTAVSEQLLRVGFSRRLVTVTKTIPYDAKLHARHVVSPPRAAGAPLPSYAGMHDQILGDKTGKRGLVGAKLEKRQRREAKLKEKADAAAASGAPPPTTAAAAPFAGMKRSEEEKKAYRAALRKQKKQKHQTANRVLTEQKRSTVAAVLSAKSAPAAAAASITTTAPAPVPASK